MRPLFLQFVLLSINCSAQDTTLKRVFPMKEGRVYYETAFILEKDKDSLLDRARQWMTAQKGYQNNLYFGRVSDWKTSITEEYYKCRIAFSLPFITGSKQGKMPRQLTYMYTVRYYVNNKFKVQIIIDDVSLNGNLAALGLPLNKTTKDTIRVEDFKALQYPSPNAATAARMRTLVYNNYKQADLYFKNCLKQLLAASYNLPVTSLANDQAKQ
jgi:hypothetical protein